MEDDDRAEVPEVLARQLFTMCGKRLRRRWFKAPAKLPRQPRTKRRHRPWSQWTDTDDHVVRIFEPKEAAEMLGRSLSSIYKRRSRLTAGKANSDRKPRKVLRREDYQL